MGDVALHTVRGVTFNYNYRIYEVLLISKEKLPITNGTKFKKIDVISILLKVISMGT